MKAKVLLLVGLLLLVSTLGGQDLEWARRVSGATGVTPEGQGSTAQMPYNNIGAYDWSLTPGPLRLTWAIPTGGTGDVDSGHGVAVDDKGYVYFTGDFSGTVDFDPGPGTAKLTAFGGTDIFLSKFDSASNFVWARQLGGDSFDQSSAVAVDRNGNIYTTGFLVTPDGVMDVFVSKLSSTGNVIWTRQMGGPGNDLGTDIAVDDSGNVFVAGEFGAMADFDPGPGRFNLNTGLAAGFGNDAFVVKLDSAGNFVWAFQLFTSGNGYGIATDNGGNIYVTGNFSGSADFDPGSGVFSLSTASNIQNGYVSKYTGAGRLVWVRQLGGSGHTHADAVELDDSANVYTTGYFYNSADFDPGPGVYNLTAEGAYDAFVSKLDSAGNFVWARRLGGATGESGYDVTADSWGNVYTAGQFSISADFDPGPGIANLTSRGATDGFLSKLDSSGNFVWAERIGDTGADLGFALATRARGIYLAGDFEGRVDFDPSAGVFDLLSRGGLDAFLIHATDDPLACSLKCSATAPSSSTVGASISFQATAEAENCSEPQLSWTFGDGAYGQGTAATHAYASPGDFSWSVEIIADDQVCFRSGTTAINGLIVPAQIVSPPAGATLAGPVQEFEWTAGAGVSEYRLSVGSSLGGDDFYFQALGTQRSAVVSNLPTDGRTLYVRLESRIGGKWYAKNTNYVAAVEAGAPVISLGGVVSANLLPRIATVSPGSIMSVFGANFSAETILYPNLDGNGDLTKILGGVCLEMNGERLPIFAVTPNQINAQVSTNQEIGPASLTVISDCDFPPALSPETARGSGRVRDLMSSVATVAVEGATPSFFLFPPLAEDGFIAARFNATEDQPPVPVAPASLFPNDSYGPSRPAMRGDIIVLYGTGWGETEAALATGQLATEAAELLPEANPNISFGGIMLDPQDVFYVGVTPSAAGLYQAVIRVPAGAQAGNNKVVLTVYGKSTPAGPVVPVALP